MIRSMTGYGRANRTIGGRNISVEIKTVNHRYFEFSSRVSRGYSFLEEKLKAYLSERIARGKVDVYLTVVPIEDTDAEVIVNHSIAAGYINALKELAGTYMLGGSISAVDLARFSDIFTLHKEPEDEERVWADVRLVLDEAVDNLLAMRVKEGAKLRADIEERAERILALVSKIEVRAPELEKEYFERLKARLTEFLENSGVDEQRIIMEAAIYADRTATNEETVRLKSHIEQLLSMLADDGAVGRKIDFIIQEMNREANTIGSKIQDIEVTRYVVEIKSELEKIREQIQNIE